MSALIYKGRYYHLGTDSVFGIERYKPRFIKTPYGLLMMNSLNDLAFCHSLQGTAYDDQVTSRSGDNRMSQFDECRFFLFNEPQKTIYVVGASGCRNPVLSIPYETLESIENVSLMSYHSRIIETICLDDPELGIEAFYKIAKRNGGVLAFEEQFMENIKGIPIEELMNHEYAKGGSVDTFLPRPTTPHQDLVSGYSQTMNQFTAPHQNLVGPTNGPTGYRSARDPRVRQYRY